MIIEILSRQAGPFIAGMIGAVLVLAVFWCEGIQGTGTVNVTALIQEFVRAESDRSVPPAQIKKDARHFAKQLEYRIRRMASRQHLVLLPSEAALAGARDYTGMVRKQMETGQ